MKINGELLRATRTKKGVNQVALSQALGVFQSFISQLEQGTKNTSWAHIEKIAQIIGCEPEEFTEGGEPSPYMQIMRDVKRLSDNQVEIVASLVKEFLCLSK